tara:strand:+ start:733 stop:891 length:159 start_codon:yes stop_codon:yes gene_type:complete
MLAVFVIFEILKLFLNETLAYMCFLCNTRYSPAISGKSIAKYFLISANIYLL